MKTNVDNFHFFASSMFTWATTNDTRDLLDLLDLFKKEGYPFSLFKVPGDWDAHYSIEHYAPQVDGAELLGTYNPKKRQRKVA